MARENLPQGQIVPVARPLGSFLRPTAVEPSRPAEPVQIAKPTRPEVIQQGSRGDVQGFNQFAQLAEALGPFSERLIKVAAGGIQLYADSEFEKGQNEVLKAQVLANQQAQDSAAKYSADGRRIAQQDPYAAVLMDKVNPFRQWGRENSLTRIAAGELMPELMRRYRDTPGIASLKPGDPALKQLQASVVGEIAQRYGINEGSRGFVENFLPQVGKAQEKLYNQHQDDYVKDAKESAWRRSAAEIAGIYRAARESGAIEWEEPDETGKPVIRRAVRSENRGEWLRGMSVLITRVSDRLAVETGIPGEASWLQRQMFEQLALISGDIGAAELADALYGAEYGPVGPDGKRPTLRDTMGPEISKAEYEQSKVQYERGQLAIKQGLQKAEEDLAAKLAGVSNGPEKEQIISNWMRQWNKAGVPRKDLLEATTAIAKSMDAVDLLTFNIVPVEEFFAGIQTQFGAAFNQKQNYQRLQQLLAGAPDDVKADYISKYGTIARAKQNEKASYPSGLIDPLISNKIRANTQRFYSTDFEQAVMRGGDPIEFLKYGKANASESVRRQETAFRTQVYQALDAATVKKGAPLINAEVTQVVSQALESYGSKDKDAKGYLFPGVAEFGTPGVQTTGPKPVAPASAKPSAPPKPRPPAYTSGQLDNVPDREKRLKDPNNPVMQGPSVSDQIQRVLRGGTPSPEVIRAAKDAGMSVGKFLERQSKFYDWIELKPADRNKLLQSSARAEGFASSLVSNAINAGTELGKYGFRVIDAALVGPAMAAPPPTASLAVAPGQTRSEISMIANSLGVDPVDVATIINFETGGDLVAGRSRNGLDRWGGNGGQYLSWIQFSPENQRRYGVRPGMSPQEAAKAVIRYFKDSGIRPGDSLEVLYQAVQAPAHVGRARASGRNISADSNGTVAGHVQTMRKNHRAIVERWLRGGR